MQNQLIAQQRINQLRLANPNMSQQPGGQPRIVLQQQTQQICMTAAPGAQQQTQAVQPPPPPYPGPPPPYPGNNIPQSTTDSQVKKLFSFLLLTLRTVCVNVRIVNWLKFLL